MPKLTIKRAHRVIRRAQNAGRRLLWRLARRRATGAPRALFIFGVQRSGTTMLGEALAANPEILAFREGHPRLFMDFRLREIDHVARVVSGSRASWVALKPLMDAHRARELLDALPGSRGLWLFRRYEDRVNSALRKFGDTNLRFLRRFAAGEDLDSWAAQGLTEDDLEFVRGLDPGRMDAACAAAVFWHLRNELLFRQGLDRDGRVGMLAYETLTQEPEAMLQRTCAMLGSPYWEAMTAGIHRRSVSGAPPPCVPPRIHELCTGTYARLEAAAARGPLASTSTSSGASARVVT